MPVHIKIPRSVDFDAGVIKAFVTIAAAARFQVGSIYCSGDIESGSRPSAGATVNYGIFEAVSSFHVI